MKKKILLLISMVAIFACLFAISVSAATLIDGIYYNLKVSGEVYTATVTNDNVNCTLETVNIPKTVTHEGNTYTVTAIDYHAFSGTQGNWPGNSKIKHVTIPETVSSIGGHVFRNCTALETVEIKAKNENGITFVDAEFYNCTSLVSAKMGESDIVSFDQYSFYGCKNLVTITYPPRLRKIGGQTFRGCSSLTNGDFSNTKLEIIGSWGLGGTKIAELKVPTTLREIQGNALQDCPITYLVLPHGFTTLGNDSLPFNRQLYIMFVPAIPVDSTSLHSGALHDTHPKVIIYSGTEYEHLTSSGKIFAGYEVKPFSEYDPNTTYTTKTFFYGAKTCEKCNGLLTEEGFQFTDIASEMKIGQSCLYCENEIITESYAPVFKNLGYSVAKFDNTGSIVCGFMVDYASLAIYNEKFADNQIGTFGVFACASSKLDDGTIFDENGDVKSFVSGAKITSGHTYFDIKLIGLSSDATTPDGTPYFDALLNVGAYAHVGDKVYYIGVDSVGESIDKAITFNSFFTK